MPLGTVLLFDKQYQLQTKEDGEWKDYLINHSRDYLEAVGSILEKERGWKCRLVKVETTKQVMLTFGANSLEDWTI